MQQAGIVFATWYHHPPRRYRWAASLFPGFEHSFSSAIAAGSQDLCYTELVRATLTDTVVELINNRHFFGFGCQKTTRTKTVYDTESTKKHSDKPYMLAASATGRNTTRIDRSDNRQHRVLYLVG